jgi:uncharacterized Tic20 family protein
MTQPADPGQPSGEGQPPYAGQQPPYAGQQPPYAGQQPPYAGQQPYPGPPYPGPLAYPPGYPQPVSPSDERTWGMLAHLSPWVGGFVGLPVLGPLVVFLMYKERSVFVRRHAAGALNFQIMLFIVSVATVLLAIPLAIVTMGLALLLIIPAGLIILVGSVVLQIMGAVAANRGQEFRYPLTPDMVR